MATKRIKLLRKCLVGTNPHPKSVGWIGDVDQQEAIGLIAVGYAKETKDEPTKELELEAVEPRLPLGMKDVRSTDPAMTAILEGKVDDVIGQLDSLTTDELKSLLALEEAAKSPRKGVIDAINEYDLTGDSE